MACKLNFKENYNVNFLNCQSKKGFIDARKKKITPEFDCTIVNTLVTNSAISRIPINPIE